MSTTKNRNRSVVRPSVLADAAVRLGLVTDAGRPAFLALARADADAAVHALADAADRRGTGTRTRPTAGRSRPQDADLTPGNAPTGYPSRWKRGLAAAGRVVGRRGPERVAEARAAEANRYKRERARTKGAAPRSAAPGSDRAARLQAAHRAELDRMASEQAARRGR